MADKKPIRWFVPRGGESFMGIAAYYLTHEENMRQSFSQPSRSATRMLPDGTRIDYIMNDVVDCIMISPPQRMVISGKQLGKEMTWDKLPPFEEGTSVIDLSLMTEDPDVEGGYYCAVSVVNGKDESGRTLPAEFSVKAGTDDDGDEYLGWSIEQGIRQDDGTYKVDGKSATLLLGADADGDCDIIAKDGKTTLKKKVSVTIIVETKLYPTVTISAVVTFSDPWVWLSKPAVNYLWVKKVTTHTTTTYTVADIAFTKTKVQEKEEYCFKLSNNAETVEDYYGDWRGGFGGFWIGTLGYIETIGGESYFYVTKNVGCVEGEYESLVKTWNVTGSYFYPAGPSDFPPQLYDESTGMIDNSHEDLVSWTTVS